MKKSLLGLLIIIIIGFVGIIITNYPNELKFHKGNPGESHPPLGSASNLYPKSTLCNNQTEYTLVTAKNVPPDQVCILKIINEQYENIPEEIFNYITPTFQF